MNGKGKGTRALLLALARPLFLLPPFLAALSLLTVQKPRILPGRPAFPRRFFLSVLFSLAPPPFPFFHSFSFPHHTFPPQRDGRTRPSGQEAVRYLIFYHTP